MMERLACWNSAGALSQKRGGTYRLPGKAQGSRAVLIAGRDPERVQKRFGSVPGQQGAYYTRASKASPSHRSMSGTTRGRMLPARGLQVAICGTCQAKLDGPGAAAALVRLQRGPSPGVSPPGAACRRPSRGPAAARGGASPATPVPGGPVPLEAGADAQDQDGDHREIGLKGAALAPIGRNSGKSVLPGCDLRPLTFTGPSRAADGVLSPVVQTPRLRFGQPVFLTAGRNSGGQDGPRLPAVDDRRQQRSFRRVITPRPLDCGSGPLPGRVFLPGECPPNPAGSPPRTLHAQATPFPGGPGRRQDGPHVVIDLPGSAPPK